jgi:hypothetical protein
MDNRSLAIDPPKIEFGQDYRKKYDQSSVDLAQPKWSQSAEWVVTMLRNGWSLSSGISGQFPAE